MILLQQRLTISLFCIFSNSTLDNELVMVELFYAIDSFIIFNNVELVIDYIAIVRVFNLNMIRCISYSYFICMLCTYLIQFILSTLTHV